MADEKLLDAGHIHTGPIHLKNGWKPDLTRCRHAVSDGDRWPSYHQCSRKVKVTRTVDWRGKAVELGYCGQHDPEKVRAKKIAWREKYDAKHKERSRQWAQSAMKNEAVDLLRKIAEGHNDPRSIALEFVAKYDEL